MAGCGRWNRAKATAWWRRSPVPAMRREPRWRRSGAWTAELPWLRVRMALHTGQAQLRDEGNYVAGRSSAAPGCGPAPTAARSCCRRRRRRWWPTTLGDAALVDLGTVQLAGPVPRPEHVWQVAAAGLQSLFPPLRSPDASHHNLPAVFTSFIGREAELAEVAALVSRERIVTLTGSGGCGKTRLALHVAADLVDTIRVVRGGRTWPRCDRGDAVGRSVASAVGAATSLRAPTPTALVLRSSARRGRTLVVIDNAEHLAGAVAAWSNACWRPARRCVCW